MIESVETVKDVEKQLADARAKLQAFEDGVDRGRLLQRLKLASPAHPVLLFRMMFLFLTGLALTAAVAVLAVPFVNPDLARRIARFDAVVPAPPGVPALPAFLAVVALCMLVGWLMTTMAALAMGRDAQMLPWEQKQHQKLVNEVTRLTTQKAVMERMRSTPAGARPRIDTPVPVSLRDRQGMTPSALGRLGESGTPAPAGIGSMSGRFAQGPGAGGNPFGRAPGSGGSVPAPADGGGGLFGRAPGSGVTPASAPRSGESANPFSQPAASGGGGGGVLARARSGSLKTTPAGAAGRLTPNFNRSATAGQPPGEEGSDDDGPFARSDGPAPVASSSNPFATPAARPGNPFGGGGGGGGNPFARPAPPAEPEPATNIFGTPPPLGGMRPGAGLLAKARASAEPSGEPDIVEGVGYSGEGASEPDADDVAAAPEGRNVRPALPKWGATQDTWLEDALQRAEDLSRNLPLQAHLRFSEEAYLPFTLVLARATPPVAVKAMVAFADYLSSIPTPPRARVELSASPGLDRSFHRNVEATLVPIYGEAVEVEQEPGRVEVVFKQPDPAWQDYPDLPIEG